MNTLDEYLAHSQQADDWSDEVIGLERRIKESIDIQRPLWMKLTDEEKETATTKRVEWLTEDLPE